MSQHPPSKSSLTITLTEPLVFLRAVDVAGAQSVLGEFAPPSALRGLLAFDLSKASRVSCIEVELQAMSYASWAEVSTSEERKIFSATQVFFRAASSPSTRRSLSVDPGVSHYANESEHHQPPPPPPPHSPPPLEAETALPAPPAPLHAAADASQRRPMRVRRRSSADHLVFQRDPVAHLNRPPTQSPVSFPPTTEEEVTTHIPTSAHFVESPTTSTSSFHHVATPTAAHIRSQRTLGHNRAASLGEPQTLSSLSSRHGQRATSSSGLENLPGKGLRSHAPLNLGSIFGRGSLPDSPVHDEGHPEGPQSNGRERGREKSSAKRHSIFPHALGRMGEALGLEEEHREVGDGWQEFRKGTYTFPISFEIPSDMPASLECEEGSVTWKLVAKVRRPGVFTPNLTTTREVHVVSIPVDAELDTRDILIERPWEDQLQYLFKISGKVFAVGSSFNVKMIFMPLAKIRIYKIAVDIEERIDSYISGMNMTRSVTSPIPLLALQNDDNTKPLLPLSSSDPLAYENSPLAALRPLGANPSDVASELLGPGPWPICAALHLPGDCGVLHPTSRNRDSSIHVTHVLRFTIRLVRGDNAAFDPKTGKRRLSELILRTPMHIFSCYARGEYTVLPRYSETLDCSTILTPPTPACPCSAERERRAREGDQSRIESSPVLLAPLGEGLDEVLERTLAYERLVSGHESVQGDAPPAYDAGPVHAPHPAVVSV